ncbi:MAG: tripartite tricarboxylate transporter TctB family protein [Deltaproteobacteria bacterium]|nr:tripartite tricarboxylate transporter TctB family protein [Deltaproteobacteria bacterium]
MKKRNINKVDVLTGLLLFILSVIFYFFVLPYQVDDPTGPLALSPAIFCKVITVVLVFLSLLLVIINLFPKLSPSEDTVDSDSDTSPGLSNVDQKKVVVTIITAFLYIFMIQYLGFFVSTALVMIFLMIYYGHRKWTHIFLVLIIVLSFIYTLFVLGLRVLLPSGILM